LSRARHRLARRQDAVVNEPTQSTTRTFIAYIDADTSVRHVQDNGLFSDVENFGGTADGHTGRTSDAFHASWYLQQFQSRFDDRVNLREQEGFLRAGAILDSNELNGNMNSDFADPNPNRVWWPWTFNGTFDIGGSTQDGWLQSTASRVYMVCNMNNYGEEVGDRSVIPMAAGDQVLSATLKMTIQDKLVHNTGSSPWGSIAGAPASLQGNKDYCVYKCVKGISTGNLADVTWFGFSGGTADCTDFWDTPGGSHVGNDITTLGTVSCQTITPPGGDPGGGGGGGGPDIGEGFGDDDRGDDRDGGVILPGENLTVEWDITHIVQDALDNESNVLRLALHGENDTDTSAVTVTVFVGPEGLRYEVPRYTFANNAVDFHSKESGEPLENLPQIEITFIDRT
jgi:hypothetical protein